MFGPSVDDSTDYKWVKNYAPFNSQASSASASVNVNITWRDVVDQYARVVGLDIMCFDNYLFRYNSVGTKKIVNSIQNIINNVNKAHI